MKANCAEHVVFKIEACESTVLHEDPFLEMSLGKVHYSKPGSTGKKTKQKAILKVDGPSRCINYI